MVSNTSEKELEIAIEKQLTGSCLEAQKGVAEAGDLPFSPNHGYQLGSPQDFNARYAIDSKRFWAFLEHTQPKELEKLQKQGGVGSLKCWNASTS